MARKVSKTPSKKKQPNKAKRSAKKSNGQKSRKQRKNASAGTTKRAKKVSKAKKPAGKGNVRKTISILNTIIASDAPITGAGIKRLAGGSDSTINRTTNMLSEIGFIEQDCQQKGFVVGPGLIKLALDTLRVAASRNMRHMILEALSLKLDQTINFGTLSGADIILLNRADPKWPLALRLDVGSRAPAQCTAIGKLLLSQLPTRKFRDTLAAMPLNPHTANSVVDHDQLRVAIDKIRETKIGIDNEEFIEGVVCISILVTADNKTIVGALSVVAPTTRHSVEDLHKFLPELRKAADQLGQTFKFGTAEKAPKGSDHRQ